MAWLLFILVMIASFVVQMVLSSRIDKYTQVATNVTGAQIARMMLEENGINDVSVTCISGTLTDHYNPQTRTVNLSDTRRFRCNHGGFRRLGYASTVS